MALTAAEIIGNPVLEELVRRQSRALLLAYEANPRVASVFATQQRWLMAHAGLSLYFRRDPLDARKGLTAARFLDEVGKYGIASPNTADAFRLELVKYGILRAMPTAGDKRVRSLEPTQSSLDSLTGWMLLHLSTLDALDGGRRAACFTAGSDMLARLQPLVAAGLLSSQPVREPERTFSLFTWLNNGGVVMDWLISGTASTVPEADRIPTGVVSITEFAALLKLSIAHLSRKLREAEALGSVGWEGPRGRSAMWISRGFFDEYLRAQSVKLAIFDDAFAACFDREQADKQTPPGAPGRAAA